MGDINYGQLLRMKMGSDSTFDFQLISYFFTATLHVLAFLYNVLIVFVYKILHLLVFENTFCRGSLPTAILISSWGKINNNTLLK